MDTKNFYSTAHLIVAAIRVLEHQKGVAPDVESLAKTLSFSLEEAHFFCRKLHKLGIIDVVEGAYGNKLFVKNHLELETLPKTATDAPIKDDIDKFMTQRQDQFKEIESIKAKQEQKKKDLFSDIEQKLKEKLKNQQ